MGREILYEGRFMRLVREGRWEYGERTNSPGAVLIVGVTADQSLILIEQHRVPLGCASIELPAGIAGDIEGQENEPMEVAARRELLEETGYSAAALKKMATVAANPGMENEVLHFFVASGLEKVGPGGGDETEDITIHTIPLTEVPAWLARRAAEGASIAQNVYVGLYFAAVAKGSGPSR